MSDSDDFEEIQDTSEVEESEDAEYVSESYESEEESDNQLRGTVSFEDVQEEQTNDERFSTELEFVHCLANPFFLNNLAIKGYFKDKCFRNYLKYLLYWKRPEYARFIRYPDALLMLDLCQDPDFHEYIEDQNHALYIQNQQNFLHIYYRGISLDLTEPEVELKYPPGFPREDNS